MGSGPLSGVRVLEFTGIGPAPFCAMLLSDLGADVIRVDRKGTPGARSKEVTARGRRSVALDLKDRKDVLQCLQLIEKADVLIEGFRPGVMERLGLGPEIALKVNPRLIFARMTGWGQDGPLANAAGHDINYIALTGALAAIGLHSGPPVPPLNLVGDFGGGSLYMAFGIACALHERNTSGKGQVIDAAIVDGAASLMAMFSGLLAEGFCSVKRDGMNVLDGSAHYYKCYECKDGRHIAVGAMEPQFYALLKDKLGGEAISDFPTQDVAQWESGAERFAAIFKTRTRDEWTALLENTDACFAPVMEFPEAHNHPHMKARRVFVDAFGVTQPAPAPRFSRTPGAIQGPPPAAGQGSEDALAGWGIRPVGTGTAKAAG